MSPEEVIEAKHALAGMAEILSDYYKKLRAEGFSSSEALSIVIGYQAALLSPSKGTEA
jgi:hypothetical protein